jgi:hypothetical protein
MMLLLVVFVFVLVEKVVVVDEVKLFVILERL